jgi:hypothetical protein
MDCEREQCPTEDIEPENIEKNPDEDQGDGSREKAARVAPSTTTARSKE